MPKTNSMEVEAYHLDAELKAPSSVWSSSSHFCSQVSLGACKAKKQVIARFYWGLANFFRRDIRHGDLQVTVRLFL
jgi:hypothetical protein